jgi:hypothetical protein
LVRFLPIGDARFKYFDAIDLFCYLVKAKI